jgi:hypothetical protein
MSDRWWIYSGELFWASPDRSIKVHLNDGGMRLWRFSVRTPNAEAQFTSDVGMGGTMELYAKGMLPLAPSQIDELQHAVQRATPPSKFDPVDQYVVDRVVAGGFEQGNLALRRLRYELHQLHAFDISGAQARIERLAPRYIQIVADCAYPTPLGLLCSKARADVQLVVEVTLRAWVTAYNANPEVSELKFDDYFGNNLTPDIPFLRAWKIIDVFRLGTNGTGNKWNAPSDIESLVFERVTSLDQLWTYNQMHRDVPRPWPFAVERQTPLEPIAHRGLLSDSEPEQHEDPQITSSRGMVVVAAILPDAAAIGP